MSSTVGMVDLAMGVALGVFTLFGSFIFVVKHCSLLVWSILSAVSIKQSPATRQNVGDPQPSSH